MSFIRISAGCLLLTTIVAGQVTTFDQLTAACQISVLQLESNVNYNVTELAYKTAVDECLFPQLPSRKCGGTISCSNVDDDAVRASCAALDGEFTSYVLIGNANDNSTTVEECYQHIDPYYHQCVLEACDNDADLAVVNDAMIAKCKQDGIFSSSLCDTMTSRFSLTQQFLNGMNEQFGKVKTTQKWIEEPTCESLLVRNGGRCEGPDGTISEITLSSLAVAGTIPPMSLLPYVKKFYAGTNFLSGTVPSLHANFELERISVSNNQLSGDIPSVDYNSKLERLYLYENEFTGQLPNLSNNTKLIYLYANDNLLTSTAPPGSCSRCLVELFGCYLGENPFVYIAPEYTGEKYMAGGASSVCDATIGAAPATASSSLLAVTIGAAFTLLTMA